MQPVSQGGFNPDEWVSDKVLEERTPYRAGTYCNWRIYGGGPPFSKGDGLRARVAYRWGDVVDWLESRKRRSTSDNPPTDDNSGGHGKTGAKNQEFSESRSGVATPAQPMAQEAA